jgi:cell division protein FtsB
METLVIKIASKTKKQLIEELSELQRRVLSMERSNKKLKNDKNALKQSAKRIRLIFDNAQEGIY